MTLITVRNATIVAQTERFAETDNAPSAWAEPIATAMSSICAKILRIAGNAMINARATAFTFSVETAHQAWQVGQAMP